MKEKCRFTSIVVALSCFALLPQMYAVSPPPDGCYANFTTAEGCKALRSLTSGVANTGIGWYALFGNSTGSFNTAVGAGSLDLNTADSNTATGAAALLFNTTGTENTANGAAALEFNDTGNFNTATGAFALFSNTTGDGNTANGTNALQENTTGDSNTATGKGALFSNTTGNANTASGLGALLSNSTGGNNTAIGEGALLDNTGNNNTAIGANALFSNTAGASNVAVGDSAGAGVVGDYNIYIGALAGPSPAPTFESETIRIGDVFNTDCFIGGIWGQTASGGLAVFIDGNGKLGTVTSSARFKDDIKPMGKASEAILSLKPVAFRYKKELDPAGTPQLGLIAEDVEKINPDLVVRDKEGKAHSVRYDQVNAMLLNEFLKEHQTVQELKSAAVKQEAMMASQQKQIEALTAGLQKVSTQLEASKPAPQVVLNRQ